MSNCQKEVKSQTTAIYIRFTVIDTINSYVHKSRYILYTWHIVTTSSTEPYHENISRGIQNRGHRSLNQQGR